MCSIRDFENIMRRIITNNGFCSVKLKKKITILMYVSVYWYITDIRIYIYIGGAVLTQTHYRYGEKPVWQNDFQIKTDAFGFR